MTFVYTVTAEVADEATAKAWAGWLRTLHFAEVLEAGALTAELVQWSPLLLEARYRFTSRAAFDEYEATHAPRLRADGVGRFPSGVKLTRRFGDVAIAEMTRSARRA